MESYEMSFESVYSEFYNEIHRDKGYEYESNQIIEVMTQNGLKNAKILDFGCGTGKHAQVLSQMGLVISGYDVNPNMIEVARRTLDVKIYEDIGSIPKEFNFVYSLFDVLSYQVLDEEVEKFIMQVNSTVKPGGWVLLDGWHYPALKVDPPENRVKNFRYKNIEFSRIVTVLEMNPKGVTTLLVEIKQLNSKKIIHSEVHKLRSFNLSELQLFIKNGGGYNAKFFNGTDYSKSLTDTDWRIAVTYQV
jgi:SAM-dependent methyltransferase